MRKQRNATQHTIVDGMRLAYAFGFDAKSLLYRDAIVCQTALLTPTEATALYFDGRYGWRLILYFFKPCLIDIGQSMAK